jgi:hypothetical protein
MAGLSSSSSPPPLTEDESKFDKIHPEGSAMTYEDIGCVSEEVLNGLKKEWELSFEKHGILQSIWKRHPSNPINKQGKKRILNQTIQNFLHSYFLSYTMVPFSSFFVHFCEKLPGYKRIILLTRVTKLPWSYSFIYCLLFDLKVAVEQSLRTGLPLTWIV